MSEIPKSTTVPELKFGSGEHTSKLIGNYLENRCLTDPHSVNQGFGDRLQAHGGGSVLTSNNDGSAMVEASMPGDASARRSYAATIDKKGHVTTAKAARLDEQGKLIYEHEFSEAHRERAARLIAQLAAKGLDRTSNNN